MNNRKCKNCGESIFPSEGVLAENHTILKERRSEGLWLRVYCLYKLCEVHTEEGTVHAALLYDELFEKAWSGLSPAEVMKSKTGPHWDRINSCDLSKPILFFPSGKIADGYHRLAKAALDEVKILNYKIIMKWEDAIPAIVYEEIQK